MKKSNQLNFRADEATFLQLAKYAGIVERTPSDFVRLLLEASLKMVEDPEARFFAPVIQDVIDRQSRQGTPLSDETRRAHQTRGGDVGLIAEDPKPYGKRRSA